MHAQYISAQYSHNSRELNIKSALALHDVKGLSTIKGTGHDLVFSSTHMPGYLNYDHIITDVCNFLYPEIHKLGLSSCFLV